MAEGKTYVAGISAKQVNFQNGNSILKLGVNVDKLCAQLQAAKNEKGYVNLGISARKEVGKYGDTHCMWIDTWKPTPKQDSGYSTTPGAKYNPPDEPKNDSDNGLPF